MKISAVVLAIIANINATKINNKRLNIRFTDDNRNM